MRDAAPVSPPRSAAAERALARAEPPGQEKRADAPSFEDALAEAPGTEPGTPAVPAGAKPKDAKAPNASEAPSEGAGQPAPPGPALAADLLAIIAAASTPKAQPTPAKAVEAEAAEAATEAGPEEKSEGEAEPAAGPVPLAGAAPTPAVAVPAPVAPSLPAPNRPVAGAGADEAGIAGVGPSTGPDAPVQADGVPAPAVPAAPVAAAVGGEDELASDQASAPQASAKPPEAGQTEPTPPAPPPHPSAPHAALKAAGARAKPEGEEREGGKPVEGRRDAEPARPLPEPRGRDDAPSGAGFEALSRALGPGAPAANATPAPAAPPVPVLQNVPLGAVPVEIGLKSLAGMNRFEIRLDPEDLGRIDVTLEIGDAGEVKARLVVDRVETLALLQRDAKTLERAFEQAGLKATDGSVDMQLRDQGSQPGSRGERGRDDRPGREPGPPLERQPSSPPPQARPIWRGTAGIDMRI
ncbi:flagellar hook-length control protein FliK [Salinarimonas soli]|uniref:Flagellar hook-length control protein-like C-terminal domain-containing protein n=1 Tax=Salinarimonas soli TaxID=1638099 RepID=A0A5B2VAR8_9HYPH|nr:flagellar hook-length control protein FliK [Salinarimonas soli]KAA2235459.1 hypothetical protein F0L46_19755 [Salinarimonas soli]